MTALPEWMYPPPADGWFAEDLDSLPEAPRHTELIDGALIFMVSPQRVWHSLVVTLLTITLMRQAPAGFSVLREMTIRLDSRNRPEPDLVITTVPYELDRTYFEPTEVQLVIEVVSLESAHRDRTIKLRKYAEAGIPHYWRIEDEDGAPAVHVYELDEPTRAYVASGIHRDVLRRPVPFAIEIDPADLIPTRS